MRKPPVKNVAIDKGSLAHVWAVQKFHRYLYGKEVVIEIDEHPLVYLNKITMGNSKLFGSALSLQPYRVLILVMEGQCWVGLFE